MLFYLIIYIISIFVAYLSDICEKQYKSLFIFFVVLFLSIVGGLRDIGVGTDTVTYSMSYYYLAKGMTWQYLIDDAPNKGYMILNYIGVSIYDSFRMCHFIIQLFTNGLIFCSLYVLSKEYKIKMWIFTFCYCFFFYSMTYNFMKQFTALALCMLALCCIVKGKWIYYIVLQLIIPFFHSSGYLFVLVAVAYYCFNHKVPKSVLYGLVILGVFVMYYIIRHWTEIIDYLNVLDVVSDVYTSRYDVDSIYGGRDGVRKSIVLLLVFGFYFCYIAFKRKIFSTNRTLYFLFLVFCSCFFYRLTTISIYLYRLFLYFSLPAFVFICSVLSNKKTLLIERYSFLFLLILDWYVYVIMHKGQEVVPYSSSVFEFL